MPAAILSGDLFSLSISGIKVTVYTIIIMPVVFMSTKYGLFQYGKNTG
jgi:hypothetical protein